MNPLLDLARAILVLFVCSICIDAFQTSHDTRFLLTSSIPTKHAAFRKGTFVLHAKKKGFGKQQQEQQQQQVQPTDTAKVAAETSAAQSTLPVPPVMNDGQKALEKLRRQRAEQKDAELRKIRELLEADRQVEQQGAPTIPEKVAMRMGKRMLPFVGLPLFAGMGSFVAFWYFATEKNIEFQPGAVAATTILILVLGLLGITYSVMSASWDPDREGSVLGTEEFERNVKNIREGLARSRENAILRERMEDLSDEEVSQALADLERREKAATTKKLTLSQKLDEELKK